MQTFRDTESSGDALTADLLVTEVPPLTKATHYSDSIESGELALHLALESAKSHYAEELSDERLVVLIARKLNRGERLSPEEAVADLLLSGHMVFVGVPTLHITSDVTTQAANDFPGKKIAFISIQCETWEYLVSLRKSE